MVRRSAAAVALVIALGLLMFGLGTVEADLYTVGVLVLFIGAIGAAVLAGEFLGRYLDGRHSPHRNVGAGE